MTRPRLESDVCDSCLSPWTCHVEPSEHGDGSTSKRESVGPKFDPDKWIRMNNLEVVCMDEIRTFWWIMIFRSENPWRKTTQRLRKAIGMISIKQLWFCVEASLKGYSITRQGRIGNLRINQISRT